MRPLNQDGSVIRDEFGGVERPERGEIVEPPYEYQSEMDRRESVIKAFPHNGNPGCINALCDMACLRPDQPELFDAIIDGLLKHEITGSKVWIAFADYYGKDAATLGADLFLCPQDVAAKVNA